MKRLPKGYGSVHLLSGERRKPYGVRIKDKNTNKYQYLGYYESEQEALLALSEYNKNPYSIDLANLTISDLWEEFQKRRFDKISSQGKYVYQAAYKNIAPLHGIKIRDLKAYQMQSVIDAMKQGWQSKSHVQTFLSQLFEIAMELDIVQKNYAKFLNVGKSEQSDLHKPFTSDEIATLFKSVFLYPYADTVLIMIFSGMRPSEMLGIRIENVHLDEKYIIAGMKTKAGKSRIIPINNKVLPFIRKRYNPNEEFLIMEFNKKLTLKKYSDKFRNLMSDLNMEHLPHDCRHTFASLADTAGMNKTAVKKIMGHSSSDITEKVYTHKSIDELLKNINMI